MSALLLSPLGVMMLVLFYIPESTGQGTGAVCESGFEWMTNSKGQSPCLVSSWLFTPCSTPSDSYVDPLPSGYHYATPFNTTASANPCRCNTVLFSTISACATCQGGTDFIVPYPENIPSGTAIPAWAYLDVRVNNTFDPAAAEAVAAQNLPESSAPPTPTTTSELNTSTPSMTMTGGSTSSSSLPTVIGGSSTSGSESKKKSKAGPIAGGVIGGLAGVALIVGAVFLVIRARRKSAASGGSAEYPNFGTNEAQTWEKSPVTSVSTQKLYDPNDPRTFPTQGFDPYASRPVQASTGYLSMDTSAGVIASNFADGRPGGGATNQNPYRGAPEL